MAKKTPCRSPQQVWEDVSSNLVHFVESIFFTLGVIVARHPWRTIVLTWCFVIVSSAGLLRFHLEKDPLKLWVPPESDFLRDTNWYVDTFGNGFRLQKILVTGDNVLQPEVLNIIKLITEKVDKLNIQYNKTSHMMKDLCFKVPSVNLFGSSLMKPNEMPSNISDSAKKKPSEFIDYTLLLDSQFYCNFLDNFPYVCLQENLLDIWKNEVDSLNNITNHDIVTKVNSVKVNPVTGHAMDYRKFLGGVRYDESGDIITAKSVLLTWYTHMDMSADMDEVGNLMGTEKWASKPLLLWEQAFLDLMHELSLNHTNINIFYEAGRSFADISGNAMFDELDKLFVGILLMFIYVQFGLSRFNWLEIKLTLGSVGLMCVGMAYVTAVSWCSAIGVSFGPVHSSLPFLLMGLGIDDMFVMKACWEQLTQEEIEKSLPHKVGLMLKHAGVSIVITSITDIAALLIGAITILPSLKSFCIYAATGVFFIFCYSVTYYVAVFTLDLKRMESNRNGVLFCYQHKSPVKTSTGQTLLQKMFCGFYRRVVFTVPVRIFVIVSMIVMTGFSIVAILRLEQRFDPQWFIPDGTYYKDFLNQHEKYYPAEGNMAMVFLGEMQYSKEFVKLYDMVEELNNQTYVTDMMSWVTAFHGYMRDNFNRDLLSPNNNMTDADFYQYLSRFLFSPIGGRFQINFKFSKPFKCGVPASNITGSTMSFMFPRFEGPSLYIPAMNDAKRIVETTGIATGDGYLSVWSQVFANWVTDEVIAVEVERNLELALLCVMCCTVVLITNLQMCMWIFICVLLTIVNVLGWMQRWGMTVDIVCCIGLELAIGLCVDYAAHVGHTFLTVSTGTRTERAYQTVTSIGSAVLLGGGSTMLALSLLSISKAYTFQSFFKIFLLVIVFGLYTGLVFLPVVLSVVGPGAYRVKTDKTASEAVEAEHLNGKAAAQEIPNCDDSLLETYSIS